MRGLRLWSESWPTPAGIWWRNTSQTQATSAGGHRSPGAPQWHHPKELSAAFRKHREPRGWEYCTWEEDALVSQAGLDRKAKEAARGARGSVKLAPALCSCPLRPRSSYSLPPTSSAGLQSKARVHDQGRAESWCWAQTHCLGSKAGGTAIPEGLPKHSGGTELLAHSAHRLKPSGWITTGRGHRRTLETWLISRNGKFPASAKPKTIQSST